MSNLKVYSVTSLVKMKHNKHYLEAKKGNLNEANLLIEELMEGKSLPLNDETIIPVIAQEESGRNKIPLAFAMYLSRESGNRIEIDVIQAVRANHTGSNAVNRLQNVIFKKKDDLPLDGENYIIVDDHVTMGGTVASLAKFIRENGGKVEKVFSISNTTKQIKLPDGGQSITPLKSEVDEARKRFGTWVEIFAGMKYEEMSRPTIQQLLKFKSLENLQKRYGNITASSYFLTAGELDSLWSEFAIDYLGSLFSK